MTDNEIMDIWDSYKRILKIHKDNVGGTDERELVISQGVADGTYELLNRQKADLEIKTMDINSLTSERDALQEMVEEQKAEIERLKCETSQLRFHLMVMEETANLYKQNHDVLGKVLKFQKAENEIAKSEARKEFAERVYRFICNWRNWNILKTKWLFNGECEWLKAKLDNLLKEMEGEE